MTKVDTTSRRIPAGTVQQMCGDISAMTLHRWLNHPNLDFPKPQYIGRRRYWREADVIEWLEARDNENTTIPRFACVEIAGQYAFVCPHCGSHNTHSAEDGHVASHCRCWPNGYRLHRAGKEKRDHAARSS